MAVKEELLASLDDFAGKLAWMQGRLTELRETVAGLDLPAEARPCCSICGVSFKNEARVQEHVYNSHDGPLPDSYRRAEQLAGISD